MHKEAKLGELNGHDTSGSLQKYDVWALNANHATFVQFIDASGRPVMEFNLESFLEVIRKHGYGK